MPPNTFSTCCLTGNLHAGKTVGKTEKLFGTTTYISGETNGEAQNIVIFTDIFGLGLNNNLLIADRLADAGFRVFIPDLFDGDCIPVELMAGKPDMAAFAAWKKIHTPEAVSAISAPFLTNLRASVGKEANIAVIGHCFGAPYALKALSADGGADTGAIAHPSFINDEAFQNVTKPLLISAAEHDNSFTHDDRYRSEKILMETKVKFQSTLFSGVTHGFAVRGDISDPNVKYAKEKVLLDQISWFNHMTK